MARLMNDFNWLRERGMEVAVSWWSDGLKKYPTTYWSWFELISLKNQTQNFNRTAGCAALSRLQSTWGECTVSIALVTVDHHNMMGNAATARTLSLL